ncbi:hypothetical protein ABW19_dt0200322 [Dactylella cylindrospora]|nr:hypothetical protein ABW19_dt0200322 [Dactylella cylindrospora]
MFPTPFPALNLLLSEEPVNIQPPPGGEASGPATIRVAPEALNPRGGPTMAVKTSRFSNLFKKETNVAGPSKAAAELQPENLCHLVTSHGAPTAKLAAPKVDFMGSAALQETAKAVQEPLKVTQEVPKPVQPVFKPVQEVIKPAKEVSNPTPEVPKALPEAPKVTQEAVDPSTPPKATGNFDLKRLHLENVAYAARKSDITHFFKGFNVESIDIPRKRDGKSRGIAYVRVSSEEEAKQAIAKLHNTSLKNRRVRVSLAKSNGSHSKSPSDKERGQDESPRRDSLTSDVSKNSKPDPNSDTVPSGTLDSSVPFRQALYTLACNAIGREGYTPDDIFRVINFDDDERLKLRDFYNSFKQEEKKNEEERKYLSLTESLDRPCSIHGLPQCMECHQAVMLKKICDEEEKENIGLEPITEGIINVGMAPAGHQQSVSWGSGGTFNSELNPEHHSTVKVPTIPMLNGSPYNVTYQGLTAYEALYMFGPKFVKEHFQQVNPLVHNTYNGINGSFNPDTPYQRQNSVVATQPGIKTHCAFFLRTGHCDFAQQGCKFSHELPPGGIAELTAQTGPRSQNGGFGPPRNGLAGSVFTESTHRRFPNSKVPNQDQGQPFAKYVGGPAARGRGRGNAFISAGNEGFNQNFPGVNINYQIENQMNGNRRRPSNGVREVHQPRQPSGNWRELPSWRDNNRRASGMTNETDGAADDEESSSDLISLSSFNH